MLSEIAMPRNTVKSQLLRLPQVWRSNRIESRWWRETGHTNRQWNYSPGECSIGGLPPRYRGRLASERREVLENSPLSIFARRRHPKSGADRVQPSDRQG